MELVQQPSQDHHQNRSVTVLSQIIAAVLLYASVAMLFIPWE